MEFTGERHMNLELGKRYIRKDGKLTGELRKSKDLVNLYPFEDPIHGFTYTRHGGSSCDEEVGVYPEDLMEEYVDTIGNSVAKWREMCQNWNVTIDGTAPGSEYAKYMYTDLDYSDALEEACKIIEELRKRR